MGPFFRSAGLLALLAAGGCGSIGSLSTDQKIFGGLQLDFDAMGQGMSGGPCSGCGPCWLLDVPFSLAADVVVLPFTIIYSLARPDEPAVPPPLDRP